MEEETAIDQAEARKEEIMMEPKEQGGHQTKIGTETKGEEVYLLLLVMCTCTVTKCCNNFLCSIDGTKEKIYVY